MPKSEEVRLRTEERLLGYLMAPLECLKDDEAFEINRRGIDIFAEAIKG